MVNELTGLEGGLEVGQKINEIIRAKADVNADTTGNAGTATKLQNTRTITLSGDISGSYSFDGSENKTVTTTLNDTTKIDGQWVSKTETLSTATAVGTYTIDLSSYLPNDNYNYEISTLFRFHEATSAASDIQVWSSLFNPNHELIHMASANSNSTQGILTVNIPISTDRTMYFQIIGAKIQNIHSIAFGYRRIGTNS